MPATDAKDDVSSETVMAVTSGTKLQYAIKTSLSLTLAYLIPMALGWPQPQTAATTVMLIAATGMASESLQKGVSRILGTVAGAFIGLSLIALFPQDRMVYLIAVSCAVSVIIYLYNAYQGDSTLFMLTAVVTLMVFNGGDADGAFLYGVDRAFMTAFGVIVYTVVASMLWPVRTAVNTRALAAGMSKKYLGAFEQLTHSKEQNKTALNTSSAELLTDGASFQTHFASVKNHADGVTDYLPEWNTVARSYKELEITLLPAIQQMTTQPVEFKHYIGNYDEVLDRVRALFNEIDTAWQGHRPGTELETLDLQYELKNLRGGSHLDAAAVASRAELLQNLQQVLLELLKAVNSILFDKQERFVNQAPPSQPAFNWLDLENFKTALRTLITFWIATGIWIMFNPPGGFVFVTLCTILVPLVSFTAATPKLLIILFTLGFLFALPAYVFLLPQMIHWLELALFLFGYAFIGFYFFKGPVSIFFLLGLFTLSIQNTMSYNVDAILLTMVMFYSICVTLIITRYFPFSSKPIHLYNSLRRRFFLHCSRWMYLLAKPPTILRNIRLSLLGNAAPLLLKLETWGNQVDTPASSENSAEDILSLNRACELLHGQLQVLSIRRQGFINNPLVMAAQQHSNGTVMAALCYNLATHVSQQAFASPREDLTDIETRLDELLGEDYLDRYDSHHLAQFYVYLNLQASIFRSIELCRKALQNLNLQELGEKRF